MKIFLLLDPPTITAQETKVVIVHGKPRFYKPENVTKAKEELKKQMDEVIRRIYGSDSK